MLWEELKRCVTPLRDAGGELRGTGFFISAEGHLLTCRHVVDLAGGVEQVRALGQPVEAVYLGPPFGEGDDLAVLRLPGYAGPAAPTSAEVRPTARYLAFGFGRDDFAEGATLEGTTTDCNPHIEFGGREVIRLAVPVDAQRVREGYSGSPVYDVERQRVVGIVSARDHTQGGLAIRIATVRAVWPEGARWLDGAGPPAVAAPGPLARRVFLSYRRREPDLSLAQRLYEALVAAGHLPFMAGESLSGGEEWSRRIDVELEACDRFVLLLSREAAASPMVREELRTADRLRRQRPLEQPAVLPVLLHGLKVDELEYGFRALVAPLQFLRWSSPDDTDRVLRQILEPLGAAVPGAPPPDLELPSGRSGRMPVHSRFYVERPRVESECRAVLRQPGGLVRVTGPRQSGKTSLLFRLQHEFREEGGAVAYLSFQEENQGSLTECLSWFCTATIDEVPELDGVIPPSTVNLRTFFTRDVLPRLDPERPLLMVLDELDSVLAADPLREGFCGRLRSLSERARDAGEPLSRVRWLLTYSTELYAAQELGQSPLRNVGTPVGLPDFSAAQVADLCGRHGLDWSTREVDALVRELGGHPHLVRLALYGVARGEETLTSLTEPTGPCAEAFRSHLQDLDRILEAHPELRDVMIRAVAGDQPLRLSPSVARRLVGLGVMKYEGDEAVVRCHLYRRYFRSVLGKQ